MFCFLVTLSFAQTKQFDLSKANCQLFNGAIYSFGIANQQDKAACLIYKLDLQLKVIDSLSVTIGKLPADNFLQLFSDTLHDFLNIYIQQKNKKLVTILRLNKLFERVATIENVDVARLNSISNFENELVYCKNAVYTIKHQTDTGGRQFYLNKYSLKSELKNFEYEFNWQFPFERKNINSAHIFYATKKIVLVYVNVTGGLKFGQWILKINSENGKLIRGTKLNDKGETNSYQYGAYLMDTTTKTLSLIGQRFSQSQFDLKANKLAISNTPFTSVYLISVDSTGELISKQDFKIPISEAPTKSKKQLSNHLLRINYLKTSKDGSFSFESDVYKNNDNTYCYLYINTMVYNLIPSDDNLLLEKSTISANQLIENYYFTNDKLDMNGKLCVDSLSEFETLFYKNYSFVIKKQFKRSDNNSVWLLSRSDIKKNTLNYSILGPVNKVYQLTNVMDVLKSKSPKCLLISSNQFLIAWQEEESKLLLKVVNW